MRVLDLLVRLALFRRNHTQGATSVLWGVVFALFLWASAAALALPRSRSVPFAVVSGIAIAIFVYLRGAGLDNPPAAQPGAAYRRLRARRRAARAAAARGEPRPAHGRELAEARAALAHGDAPLALFLLREARRVAVAQGRPDELRQVAELAAELARAGGRTQAAGERLASEAASLLGADGAGPRVRPPAPR